MAYRTGMPRIFAQLPGDAGPQPVGPTPVAPVPDMSSGVASGDLPNQPYTPSKPSGPASSSFDKSKHLPLIAIIIVIALAAIAVVYIKFIYQSSATTTLTTTSIPSTSTGKYLSSCGNINSPGSYQVNKNISTSTQSGSCINITASNVQLTCNKYALKGSGPYSGVPPFSTGIKVLGNNDSVSFCKVLNFSYGISATGSSLSVYGDNLSNNYMSGLYLTNVQNGSIYNNQISGTVSNQGGLYMTGSSNNKIFNNTLKNNFIYGIYINSTGNLFNNNLVQGRSSSFACSTAGGLPGNNKASGNICSGNTGCSFLVCSGTNIPVNLSKIILSNKISGCGSIVTPGAYSFSGPINMNNYVNTSIPASATTACININSGGVTLNCKGYPISNASTGIILSRKVNVTISNCTISANYQGIVFSGTNNSKATNINIKGSISGIVVQSSSVDFFTNVTISNNVYGIFMKNTTTDTVSGFKVNHNTFGLYLSNSSGDIFASGQAFNNTGVDVYATPDSANASYNLMTKSSCGLTNTAWATCTNHIAANLSFSPLFSCATISRSGNYLLSAPLLISTQTCFNIRANNVNFNCNGQSVGSVIGTQFGYVMEISNSTNVNVQNCNFQNFADGIIVQNSTKIHLINITDGYSLGGVLLNNVAGSTFIGLHLSNNTWYGIGMYNSRNNTLKLNNISYVLGPGAGIIVNASPHNLILNNSGYKDYDGIDISGPSNNNTVQGDVMFSSKNNDYYCSAQNTGINAEFGGIDSGASKLGCNWLAVVPPTASPLACAAYFNPNFIGFSGDAVYTTGTRCFSTYNSTLTINCQGHTIIATNGGILGFAGSIGTLTIQNCYLKGFSGMAVSSNSTLLAFNNTVYSNLTNLNHTVGIINITGGRSMQLSYNNITTPRAGIYTANTQFSSMTHNKVNGAAVGYALFNTTGLNINYNYALSGNVGIALNSSTQNNFQNNNFMGNTGMLCTGRATPSSGDVDVGGNICSVFKGCAWISTSLNTCP